MLKMTDEAGGDAKLLAVPVDKLCNLYRQIESPRDFPEQTLAQISHFFEHYKDLEPGKWVKVEGWVGPEEAKAEILDGVKSYAGREGKTALLARIIAIPAKAEFECCIARTMDSPPFTAMRCLGPQIEQF